MSHCPDEEQLRQFLRQNLPESEQSQVQQHINDCTDCHVVLDRLTQHPNTPSPDDVAPKDSTLNILIDRLRAAGPPVRKQTGSPATDTDFAGYTIIREIARGGSGTLYQARDPRLDRDVAIKLLHETGQLDGEMAVRLQREARAVAALDSEHVVKLYDLSSDAQGRPFLVMEYVEGMTLADRLAERETLPAKEAAAYACDLASALMTAHAQSLIHRDVKPSNVLLSADSGRIKLTDFGLVLDEEVNTRLTREGALAGTPNYMSPEQIRNPHFIDHRSDIYSLGALLYEMLTGQTPFRGVQRMTLMQILHDEPRTPRQLNDTIPRDLETICLKAMAKEPSRRYATARDFQRDLQLWLEDKPITARPTGRIERAVRWCRRNSRVAGLMAAIAALLLLFAVGGTIAAVRMRALKDTADQQRNIALQTLQSMVYDVYERLDEEGDPSTYVAQREVLKSALRGLDGFPRTPDVTESVGWTRLAAMVRMGIIEYRLDNDRKAKRQLKAALQFGDELDFDGRPANAKIYRRVRPISYAHFTMGELEAAAGNTEVAADHYRRSLKLDEGLVATDPDNIEYLLDLVSSLSGAADIELELGDYAAAAQHCERCESVMQMVGNAELVEEPSGDAWEAGVELDVETDAEALYMPDLYYTWGQALELSGSRDVAIEKYREAMKQLTTDYDPELSDQYDDELLANLTTSLVVIERERGNSEIARELISQQEARYANLFRLAGEWEDDDMKDWLRESRATFRDTVAETP